LAEVAHQAAVADKNRQRAQAAAVRDQARRQREAERLQREYEKSMQLQFSVLEKEQRQARIAAQEAEVERLNGELAMQLADIDNVLAATLDVDDYVDLERLRTKVKHPRFQSQYSDPVPAPMPIEAPPEPVYVEPEPPRGIGAVFGGKKKHAEAIAAAQAAFAQAHQQWQQAAAAVPMQQLTQLAEHRKAEETRQTNLAADRARYEEERAQRQREADEFNAALDQLIHDLERGTPEAVEEYLSIVFGNSVYPESWPWPPAYTYDAATKELSVELEFPAPGDLPIIRQYKYIRAKDEITAVEQTQKEQRERYAALISSMTLRTLHEVWEADRGELVTTISLVGSVSNVDPATGKDTRTPLIAVAVDRRTFEDIDLRRVAPAETVRHLGAVVSKNPLAFSPIKLAPGVRAH
jgi:restriction system protein